MPVVHPKFQVKHREKQLSVYIYTSLVAGDATLVFEIELFEFHGEDVTKDTDLGVVKRVKVNGEGWDMPNDGAQVEVQLKGSVEGKQFEDRTLSFEMGEGGEIGVPRGVEIALEKMKVGHQDQDCLSY